MNEFERNQTLQVLAQLVKVTIDLESTPFQELARKTKNQIMYIHGKELSFLIL